MSAHPTTTLTLDERALRLLCGAVRNQIRELEEMDADDEARLFDDDIRGLARLDRRINVARGRIARKEGS